MAEGADATVLQDNLTARLERGEFDLIAAGRVPISDAQWWTKFAKGARQDVQRFDATDLAALA